jgi:hypothetical protein
MAINIPDLVAGSEDTLLKTERGNEIITAVNALANMTFLPADAAKLDVGPQGGAVMTFDVSRFGGGTPADIEAVVRQVLSTATVRFRCETPGVIDVYFTVPPPPP